MMVLSSCSFAHVVIYGWGISAFLRVWYNLFGIELSCELLHLVVRIIFDYEM